MTEAELIAAFSDIAQMFLTGLQASFTVVSAYIVALYFFLGRAPFLMRLLAFAFFTAVLAVLGLFLVGAVIFSDGIAIGLTEQSISGTASSATLIAAKLVNTDYAYAIAAAAVLIGIGVYLSLFYLTFFYRWRAPTVGTA
jgi:hypothetical protein